MFEAVTPRRTADAVFDQVMDQIVTGELAPGQSLPGERELSAQLGVSRGVVREALQRLSQAGVVDIRHGGTTTVRDYQSGTDMNLLGRLIFRPDGNVDAKVIRSTLEMRISIGSDAARLCALRADETVVKELTDIVDQLAETEDVLTRQDLDLEFWATVVRGSDNIVYRIAYNGMAETYRPLREVIASVVVPELDNVQGHRAMVSAIATHDTAAAERAGRAVLESSVSQWAELLDALVKEEEEQA